MIGFETIGNATVTVFDDMPILCTDPWLTGSPYYGSWSHQQKIPKTQLDNIKQCKYVWLSHGHPDHIDDESIKHLTNATFLIPDHYGNRITITLIKILKPSKLNQMSGLNYLITLE